MGEKIKHTNLIIAIINHNKKRGHCTAQRAPLSTKEQEKKQNSSGRTRRQQQQQHREVLGAPTLERGSVPVIPKPGQRSSSSTQARSVRTTSRSSDKSLRLAKGSETQALTSPQRPANWNYLRRSPRRGAITGRQQYRQEEPRGWKRTHRRPAGPRYLTRPRQQQAANKPKREVSHNRRDTATVQQGHEASRRKGHAIEKGAQTPRQSLEPAENQEASDRTPFSTQSRDISRTTTPARTQS